MNKKVCSSIEHEEIKSNSYCKKCEIYMCNKCEIIHSKLCKNHQLFIIGKDNEDVFTGFCKGEKHNDELEFYCKTHNQLCCAACLCKIKKKEIGKHKDCDVCIIEDIKDVKINKLKENVKYLEELSTIFEDSLNKLKIIFEKICQDKEELKLNIQKIFTKIRNELNHREDVLLLEVDKYFEKIYFKEEMIKESEKLPNKIKISLEKSKNIDKKEENNNKLKFLINDCINVENNIKEINNINENIKKYNNSINSKIIFHPNEKDINEFLENIKTFGKIINDLDDIKIFQSNIINKEYEKVIINWIPNKIISTELIFDTDKDGDTVDAFKKKCQGISPTLVIVKTTADIIFGGFATSKWVENKVISDNNSFVFSLNPHKKYNVKSPDSALYGYSYSQQIMFQFGCYYFRIAENCTHNYNNLFCDSSCYEKGLIQLNKNKSAFMVSKLEIFKLKI